MDPGGQGARGPKRASEAKQDPLRLKKRPRDKSDVPPPRRNKHNNTADGQPPTNKGSGGKCPPSSSNSATDAVQATSAQIPQPSLTKNPVKVPP